MGARATRKQVMLDFRILTADGVVLLRDPNDTPFNHGGVWLGLACAFLLASQFIEAAQPGFQITAIFCLIVTCLLWKQRKQILLDEPQECFEVSSCLPRPIRTIRAIPFQQIERIEALSSNSNSNECGLRIRLQKGELLTLTEGQHPNSARALLEEIAAWTGEDLIDTTWLDQQLQAEAIDNSTETN